MIRRPPRSTQSRSSAASDVYKRQLLRIYPENPAPRHVSLVAKTLKDGGLVIYPTDSVYAIGCDMYNQDAIERLCQVIGKKSENAKMALICHDLKNISEYSLPFSNPVYKLMRSSLPGAYTFILKANNKVPKLSLIHISEPTRPY
eukprot:TRINITY_DN27118_c0_g1_i1.p1 TRINITY_DN27118_c0_g1~~TRINITY_DN27118_c0_g1_i1.p1  ORF type:complete len:145 (+),score=29.25 TRINITY_DN27118_c0_g1_i1:120-554(+)